MSLDLTFYKRDVDIQKMIFLCQKFFVTLQSCLLKSSKKTAFFENIKKLLFGQLGVIQQAK
jgi:hypothetical protein